MFKIINKIMALFLQFIAGSVAIAFIACLLIGIGLILAACIKHTGVSDEWANMIAWVQTWAK